MSGITDLRPRMLTDGIDSDWSGLHGTDRSFLNGHNQMNTEGQVDMLDIPGKGRCSVYIARYGNYNFFTYLPRFLYYWLIWYLVNINRTIFFGLIPIILK